MRLSHRLNVLGLIAGLSIFFLAVTEINNLCAPLVWSHLDTREVWSILIWHWRLESGAWYNMMMLALGIGLIIACFSLWFWEDHLTPT